ARSNVEKYLAPPNWSNMSVIRGNGYASPTVFSLSLRLSTINHHILFPLESSLFVSFTNFLAEEFTWTGKVTVNGATPKRALYNTKMMQIFFKAAKKNPRLGRLSRNEFIGNVQEVLRSYKQTARNIRNKQNKSNLTIKENKQNFFPDGDDDDDIHSITIMAGYTPREYSEMIKFYCQNNCVAAIAARAYGEANRNAPAKPTGKTIQRAWMRLVETGSVMPSERECGVHRTILTERKEEEVLDFFQRDGTRSIRKAAWELDVSRLLDAEQRAPGWQDRSNKKRCFSQLMLAKLLCKTLKKIGSENWKEKEIKEGISKWLIQASTRVSRGKKTCAEVSSDEDDNVTSWNTRIRRERLTFIEFLRLNAGSFVNGKSGCGSGRRPGNFRRRRTAWSPITWAMPKSTTFLGCGG
ncbi:hypothetical protein PV325_006570, partial [Microctonus aethiopoides]